MIYALHQETGTNIGIKVTYLPVKPIAKRSSAGTTRHQFSVLP